MPPFGNATQIRVPIQLVLQKYNNFSLCQKILQKVVKVFAILFSVPAINFYQISISNFFVKSIMYAFL